MIIDLEHIRKCYKKDRFATDNGIVIDSVSEDCVAMQHGTLGKSYKRGRRYSRRCDFYISRLGLCCSL